MLKQLFDWAASFIFLVRDTSDNKRAIADLTERVEALTEEFRDLAFQLRRLEEREKNEREKLVLQLENGMLKLDRRLPELKKSRRKR